MPAVPAATGCAEPVAAAVQPCGTGGEARCPCHTPPRCAACRRGGGRGGRHHPGHRALCYSSGAAAALRRGLVQHGRPAEAAGGLAGLLCCAAPARAGAPGAPGCPRAGHLPCMPAVDPHAAARVVPASCCSALQGQLAAAIASYEQALAAAPNLEVVQHNMAAALNERGTQLKAAGAGGLPRPPLGAACPGAHPARAPGCRCTEPGPIVNPLPLHQHPHPSYRPGGGGAGGLRAGAGAAAAARRGALQCGRGRHGAGPDRPGPVHVSFSQGCTG